jgi:hypothetical protein
MSSSYRFNQQPTRLPIEKFMPKPKAAELVSQPYTKTTQQWLAIICKMKGREVIFGAKTLKIN